MPGKLSLYIKCLYITKSCLFKYTENFTTKKWKFSDKKIIFYISAQNMDCGYSLAPSQWGGSNEFPQSMFLSRKNKNNLYPYKPQFYCIKVGFKGGQNYGGSKGGYLYQNGSSTGNKYFLLLLLFFCFVFFFLHFLFFFFFYNFHKLL